MLPKIGQGVGLYEWREEHKMVLRKGIELGLNYLDSGEKYGSEDIVREVIKDCRDDVIIGTKFGPLDNTRSGILKSIDRSLSRLNVDHIDLYQLHWTNPLVPLEESLETMLLLQEQGKIIEIGVGNLNINELKRACKCSKIYSFQAEYNLFDRSIEKDILPFCKSKGIQVIAYRPLDHGRICSIKQKPVLDSLAKKYEKGPSQIALSWVVSQGHTAIPTARQMKHLIQNADSLFSLDAEDICLLSNVKTDRLLIPPSEIIISATGEDSRQTYRTLDEAKFNHLGFTPSPLRLASSILKDRDIKPVRVVRSLESGLKFKLIEGRIRYWGWVIALGDDEPIPALVREN